jgi:glycosyltransferase involved in cell wall biosynthesis
MRSTLIPNVMDFERPPADTDGYADDLRASCGIRPDAYLLLQPTRVVPRKRIERAIEFARKLELPCQLLVSHGSGDEGHEYQAYLAEYADLLGITMVFAEQRFAQQRGSTPAGEPVYSLADAYQRADLVTYPSRVEGFGNAFLETIYYRRPLLMSGYEIFKTDIQPKGFEVISFGEFIADDTVRRARQLLLDPSQAEEMADRNYQLGRRYYSFRVLRRWLQALIEQSLEQTY